MRIITPLPGEVLNQGSIYVEWEGVSTVNYSVEMDGSGFQDMGQALKTIYHGLDDGQPVPNVQVDAEGIATEFSDQEGSFLLRADHGPLKLRLSKDGFKTREVEAPAVAGEEMTGHIQLERTPDESSLSPYRVLVLLLLVLLISAFVLFAVIKVGRETGLIPEE